MKYRILVETEASGKKWYLPQRKVLYFFWRTFREVRDMSMAYYRINFPTIEEAARYINQHANSVYANKQKAIVKKEIVDVLIHV